MGIGGAVRMRGYYDWGGAMPSAGFSPYLIPMTPDPASMRHLDATSLRHLSLLPDSPDGTNLWGIISST